MKRILALLFALILILPSTAVYTFAADSVIYVCDSGSDASDGLTAETAMKTLAAAAKKLASGGTVVICGPLTLDNTVKSTLPDMGNAVITSRYNGTDYRLKGAVLVLKNDIKISSDITFEYLNMRAEADIYISGRGHNVTFGDGLSVTYSAKATHYPMILGGDVSNASSSVRSLSFYNYTLTVNSGTWHFVKGTNLRTTQDDPVGFCGNVVLRINGGEFKSASGANEKTDLHYVSCGGQNAQNGFYLLEINGGTFNSYIFGSGRSGANTTGDLSTHDGDVSIIINGGTFNSRKIGAVHSTVDTRVNGDFYLYVSDKAVFTTSCTFDASGVNGRTYVRVPERMRASLPKTFDKVIYVNGEQGSDNASGLMEKNAVKTVEKALSLLNGDGVLVICGKTPLPTQKTGFEHRVTLTSRYFDKEYAGTLILGGNAYLDFDYTLENTTLEGSGTLYGGGKYSLVGEGVTVKGSVDLNGGSKDEHTLLVYSGEFGTILGGDGSVVQVYMAGGSAKAVYGAASAHRTAVVIAGGKAENVYALNGGKADEAGITLAGGKITGKVGLGGETACFTLASKDASINVDGEIKAEKKYSNLSVSGFEPLGDFVFAESLGSADITKDGTGVSPEDCAKGVTAAVSALAGAGGTVVIAKRTDIADEKTEERDKLLITSLFAAFDYRLAFGAEIRMSGALELLSETKIEKVNFLSCSENAFIAFNGKGGHVGSDVSCEKQFDRGATAYISLVGGQLLYLSANASLVDGPSVLTVDSGSWKNVTPANYRRSGGTGTDKQIKSDVTLNINGGYFYGVVGATGMNRLTGNATLNITGGEFHCGVYGVPAPSPVATDKVTVNGDVTINVSGGLFCGPLDAVYSPDVTTLNGNYKLNITGGDLSRVASVTGTNGLKGKNTSEINIAENIDVSAPVSGTAQFTNPVADYADPMVMFINGYYYYTYASYYNGKPAMFMTKAANICDIGTGKPILLWSAHSGSGCESMTSLWAPAMYVLDGKVWIYATCISSSAEGRRIHVWEGVSGNPEDGVKYRGVMKNTDEKIFNYNRPCVVEYGGKRYLSFGGIYRKEDKTASIHKQCIMIAEISNPFTFSTEIVPIIWPTKSWEIEGNIMIVEGPYQINSPDGKLFLPYSAAQTALDDYCVGLVEFVGTDGDLLKPENWKKSSQPILKKNAKESIYSSAGAMFTPSPDGSTTYVVYHSKLHSRTSYTGRCLFISELTWVNGRPVIRQPEALDTVYTIPLNPITVAQRIRGFANREDPKDPEPVTEPVTVPVTEPVTEPATAPVTGDVTVPPAEPAVNVGVMAGIAALTAAVGVLIVNIVRAKKKNS